MNDLLNAIVSFFVIAAARRHLWNGIGFAPGTLLSPDNYDLAMDVVYDEDGNDLLCMDHPSWVTAPDSDRFKRV